MGLDKSFKIDLKSRYEAGKRDLISDVPGVTVGHCTVKSEDGSVNTGVTAIMPHQGNIFRRPRIPPDLPVNPLKKTEEEQENKIITQLIREYDEQFNHALGYRRMTGYINRLNQKQYGEKRIHRLMRMMGIHSIIRPKKKKYQQNDPEAVAENVLKRNFNASKPNEKWATDVTEFKWYDGPSVHKLYLSAILDLYDRSIVGYVVSRRNDISLVFTTFDQAVKANPDAKPLFHSDRGFQYTSRVFQCKLAAQGMTQSMSRVGHCIDNGPTEGFWGIVKAEMYNLRKFNSVEVNCTP